MGVTGWGNSLSKLFTSVGSGCFYERDSVPYGMLTSDGSTSIAFSVHDSKQV